MAPGSLSHFAFLEHMDSARGEGLLVAHGLGSPLDRAQGPKPRPPGKESERLWLCPQLGSQLLRLSAPCRPCFLMLLPLRRGVKRGKGWLYPIAVNWARDRWWGRAS